MCKESLAHSLLLVYEFAQLRFADQAVRKKNCQGRRSRAVEQGLAAGTGVLLLTPHLGCWEILGAYLGESYLSFSAV